MADVSVIIPCYNQGEFLQEAVESVRAQIFKNLEIIIVNDGSDDGRTPQICAALEGPGIKVLNTTNQGLAAARNNGIGVAEGAYILPLDADDKIAPEYLSEAVKVIEADNRIGIVYCQARLFGAVEGDWNLPDYSLTEMLRDNVIFCTALFRREDWVIAGGYDTGMVYGWEDYEFWLALIERGQKVHRLDGRYFFYRVSTDSMVRSKEKSQKVEMFKRIFQRHQNLFSNHIEVWLDPLLDLREQYLTGRLYVDSGQGVSDASSVTRKVEPGKRTLRFPLDQFARVRALRFDPSDCPVCIEIEHLELAGAAGKVSIDPASLKSNADCKDGTSFMFSTDDPQIYLCSYEEMPEGVKEVVITINLVCYGNKALKAIISRCRETIKPPAKKLSMQNLFKSKKS